MPTPEYETSPGEVRNFALLQVGLTALFMILLFYALGGAGEDYPPAWLSLVLVVAVAIGAFLAERVWLSTAPLDAATARDELARQAVGIFAGQIVRKLVYTEAPVVLAVAVAFVGSYGGWPILVGGLPGIAVLAFETWPGLRNASMTEAMLDAEGADTGLVESFREW